MFQAMKHYVMNVLLYFVGERIASKKLLFLKRIKFRVKKVDLESSTSKDLPATFLLATYLSILLLVLVLE